MPRSTRFRSFALAVVVAVAAACADAPTSPSALTADALGGGPSLARSAQVKQREDAEKQRVKQEREATKAYYQALKKAWKKGKKLRNPEVMSCEPQEYDADVKVIGPEGGELKMGPHKLVIPPGALSEEVVITAEAPVSEAVEVRFSPHGLTFAAQPELTLSYKQCFVPQGFDYRIAYVDEWLNVLEWPFSVNEKHTDEVTAWIDHFSGYVVAYRK
ncbi:MAG TPA: hypothetical protein VFS05_10300 [Gemmatimonadaceae bacterium]|nr:hypothetical protein [Gemmatimonadaceae bacterium]